MQDDEIIVDLFWDRNDNALKLLADKYGGLQRFRAIYTTFRGRES